MVVDPFSALGIAANIVQFVEVGFEIISKAKEVSKSSHGITKDHEAIKETTLRLQRVCASLKHTTPHSYGTTGEPNAEDELMIVAGECRSMANELLGALEHLQARDPSKKFQTYRAALETVWKKSKIKDMEKQLVKKRGELLAMMGLMQDERQSRVLSSLRTLAEDNRQYQTQIDDTVGALRRDVISSMKQMELALVGTIEVDESTKGFLRSTSRSTKDSGESDRRPPINTASVAERVFEAIGMRHTIAVHQRILRSLCYSAMEARHSGIPGAYPETFEWMFESGRTSRAHTRFSEWLVSDSPIYWVSGKAGSGKSTLMKFLVGDPRTRTHLQRWAGSRTVATASFFFWMAGTTMQQTQKGLLQSLLFEIIRQCPNLIETILDSSRWRNIDIYQDEARPWTKDELLGALTRLKGHDLEDVCFCFFIDGLDEYSGDHNDIVRVVKGLVALGKVKICLSSRPWNIFESAFGADPIRKIYIQEFNHRDIEHYVHESLGSTPEFRTLLRHDPQYQHIIDEIVGKAQGVFLWVYLVVRSLIEGLHNSDRIRDLHRRVQSFPADLDEYFRHIILSLDRIYREQAARAFQVALAAQSPLTLLNYWFSDLDEEDDGFVLSMVTKPLEEAEFERRLRQMQRRLNGRCKGLLEVCIDEGSDPPFRTKVEFLHRTVRDFLHTTNMQLLLADWTALGFNADLTIVKTILAEIKCMRFKPGYLERVGHLSELVAELMSHARRIETQTGRTPTELLDSLDTTLASTAVLLPTQAHNAGIALPWAAWQHSLRDSGWQSYDSFSTYAVSSGLLIYVQQKLEHEPAIMRKKRGRPLLDYVLRPVTPPLLSSISDPSIYLHMLSLLLRFGADPNGAWLNTTVWKLFLHELPSQTEVWPYELRYEMVKMNLLHGASKDVKVDVSPRYLESKLGRVDKSQELHLAAFFELFFKPADAAELNDIMNSQGRLRFMKNWLGWK